MTANSANSHRAKLMIVMGTRPEVIKLAPIVLAARSQPDRFETSVVVTGQHRQMLDQMLETFEIHVDLDLHIMRHDQNLAQVTSAAIEGLYPAIEEISPDFVIVQGDTTTTFMGALAAFYHQIPVAHVEAGLRTHDKSQPFPEEINRRLTSQIADFHFAPTERSRENLRKEGTADESIWVAGNTCIDALFQILKRLGAQKSGSTSTRRILLTSHRRENHGAPLEGICRAVLDLVKLYPDLQVTYPVHLSPQVRSTVFSLLGDHERIDLVDPLEYQSFVLAMHQADIILTDSGGIQEEAPALGKPVLVLRETTERAEGIDAGTLRLVGTDRERIVEETRRLLDNPKAYDEMSRARNPFGDGEASKRILDVLAKSTREV